jgi:hypothetical protein
MNAKLEKWIMILLIILLIGLAACAKPQEKKPGVFGPVIHNAEAFGKALGCMAAPSTCKKSQEQIDQEQKEITKDFQEIDKENSKK